MILYTTIMLQLLVVKLFAHQSKDKLERRAIKYVILGYLKGVKGDKLLIKDSPKSKIIINRDVILMKLQCHT